MYINVYEYLLEACEARPERPAILAPDVLYTNRDLLERSQRIATRLATARRDIKAPVAVLMRKSPACFAAFLGALASGNFYVPLSPAWPAERLNKILENLQPAFLLAEPGHEDLVGALSLPPERVVRLDETLMAHAEINEELIAGRLAKMIDTDPVYIKYTSGSTGTPKGVVLPQRAVIDYIEWAHETYRLRPTDVIANQAPFTFDASVQDLYMGLRSGATIHLVPEQCFAFPAALVKYLAEHRITWFCWVPSVLVHVANMNLLEGADTSSLHWVTVLGETMPTKHFLYWKEHCPRATLVNTYGPTETAIASTYYVLDREFSETEPLPIGRPCRNTEVLVLDEQGEVAAGQEVGEICIRGSGLALGYWNDLERTNAAFPELVWHRHFPERIYRTGDLGYWNQRGELMFVGRLDTQIKHLGYRIELGEIEAAASGLAVVDQVCVLYDDEKREIVLVYKAENPLDPKTTRSLLLESLPQYMLPRRYERVESFPLNPNGKVDRKLLQAQFLKN